MNLPRVVFYLFVFSLFVNTISCINVELNPPEFASHRNSLSSKPHHYQVETSIPPALNFVFVNSTITVKIWPKTIGGENTTVEESEITVLTKPREIVEVKRVETSSTNVMTLELIVTKAYNPVIIYFIEDNEPIAEGIKIAAVAEDRLERSKTKATLSRNEAQVSEIIDLSIELKDAFGIPTWDGVEELEIVGSTELHNLNMLAIPPDPTEEKKILRFTVNSTVAGDFYLNITYQGFHVNGSPVSFKYLPGPFDHQKSRILGFGSWVAALREPNTLYVQVLDQYGNEVISVPTPISIEFENKDKEEADKQEPPSPETIAEIRNKISLKGWSSVSKKQLETLEYETEYLGKSTWGVRYTLHQSHTDKLLLGLYYEDERLPIGKELLPVYAQQPGFPYPPNSYKMAGPYPARPELLEPAFSAISAPLDKLKSYSLDENGWLPAYLSPISISDSDYRGQFMGTFHVEEEGVFLFICLGADSYTIDTPILYSGDIWNVHELTTGYHTLQVSTFGKRDWNFNFQCRFQSYTPIKAYASDTIVPDMIQGAKRTSPIHVLLQNLYTHPITDLQVSLLAVNDSTIQPKVSFTEEKIALSPQEFTQVPIQLEFSEEGNYHLPKNDLLIVVAISSSSTKTIVQIPLTIRVRSATQAVLFSFKDRDESIQSAVAIPPTGECNKNGCPVAVVISAGGVSITTLAEFFPALPNAWWLFPKGRTLIPHEFGPLLESNTMATVDGLSAFVKSHEHLHAFPVDANAIVSVGSHHHGGRGALVLANHNPDRMLGVSADSGWIKHSSVRIDDFIHPRISALLLACQLREDISLTTSNFRGVPFFAGSGQGDTAGYPWRLFYQQTLLAQEKVEARVDSKIGLSYKKHATAAVQPTEDVLNFVRKRVEKGVQHLPKKFTVSSWHPGIFQGRGGVHITALKVPMVLGTIQVEIQGELWVLNTSNTLAFELLDIGSVPRASQILIDGVSSFYIDTTEKVSFVLEDGKWKEQKNPSSFRNMNQYGPVNRLFEEKITIVCGTNASPEVVQFYQLFAIYISNELLKQHRSTVDILPDVQYLRLQESERTNVIVLGGPQSNKLTNTILQETPVPVHYENGEISLAGCKISGEKQVAALFLAPHGDHTAFVVSASSVPMMHSATHILPLHYPYDAFPDFVLLEEQHTWKGGNGILSAGYWDSQWNYAPLASVNQCPTYIPPNEKSSTLW